jgi:hypothetical protein
LICNSRDNGVGDEKSEWRAGYLASASKGVDVSLGRGGVEMSVKKWESSSGEKRARRHASGAFFPIEKATQMPEEGFFRLT